MFITYGVRSIFLTFCFPAIIDAGRRWWENKSAQEQGHGRTSNGAGPVVDSEDRALTPLLTPKLKGKGPESTVFDLWFFTGSFVLEGILTAATAFCWKDWHLYIGKVCYIR